MREYIWYFGYYFAKIFAWKVFLFCTKIVQKTFLFPAEQVTIQCPQETSPKTTLKPKSSHFSLLFCQKSYLITTIQFKLVAGIICIYGPILLYFKIFYLFVQICEISCDTFSIYHKNEDPHHSKCKKETE